ncbi:hypothetical protein CH35J_004897 [Colletotrichum higginsianum]|uniref:Uncharacterized protein n=1 Tax=Colletotrichum higginsianum TaxID=80884 RepID=A0A4T0W7V8_9PEZI|nr:hypothetical protein CH35J_004897 [Colletotrichum higginsianum]
MNSVRELMFSYNMENRIRTSSDKIRRFDGSLETSSHQGLAITNDSEANDSYQNEVKPVIPYTKYMMQCSVVYKDNAPLSVYTNIAVSEAIYYSSGSEFWKTMYKPLETITCAYTTPGLIEVNNLVSIEPDPCHRGFLDPYYTPQSKAAGKVRIFCTGVCVRIMATRIIEIAQDIMSSCSGLL